MKKLLSLVACMYTHMYAILNVQNKINYLMKQPLNKKNVKNVSLARQKQRVKSMNSEQRLNKIE